MQLGLAVVEEGWVERDFRLELVPVLQLGVVPVPSLVAVDNGLKPCLC